MNRIPLNHKNILIFEENHKGRSIFIYKDAESVCHTYRIHPHDLHLNILANDSHFARRRGVKEYIKFKDIRIAAVSIGTAISSR